MTVFDPLKPSAFVWETGEDDVITVPWGHPRTVAVVSVEPLEDFSQQVRLRWWAAEGGGCRIVPAYTPVKFVSRATDTETPEEATARMQAAMAGEKET
jgi:hypothetical protein